MDDDRPRHIGESIDAYIRTHKIDDLFTRMLSATLSERPDNAREYIRKLCSNDNIKEENDTTKMMKEESDDRRKEEQEKMEAIINALIVGGGTTGLALRQRRTG